MLRFFRSIRQNLLQQGKVSRYLGYAAGEIFLIMVGIFLALQLNNWNDRRLDRVEEREILNRIRVEVKAGFDKADRNLRNLQKMKDALVAVEAVFKGRPVEDNYNLLVDVAQGASISWHQPDLPNITYAELVSTGKIGLIERIELRDQIAGFYDDVYHFEKTAALRVNDYAKVAYSLVPRKSVNDGRNNDNDVNDNLSEAARLSTRP
jgi:Tfp pilus assembly protein PilO